MDNLVEDKETKKSDKMASRQTSVWKSLIIGKANILAEYA